MTELELLRELRADLPGPDTDALARGRSRLLELIDPRPSRTGPVRLWSMLAAGAAVAAVAVWLIAGVAGPGGGRHPGVTRSLTQPAAPSFRLTAQVLRAAERASAALPVRRPRPGQWIFSRTVEAGYHERRSASDNWIRFDGSQSAYYLTDGHLLVHDSPAPPRPASAHGALAEFDDSITPLSTYDALASLPRSPERMLSVITAAVSAHPDLVIGGAATARAHATVSQLQFALLANLLWNGAQAAPPSAEAAVFRTIARIPGVTVIEGLRTAAGQPAIGLADRGDEQQLLLDPHDYRVIGMRTVSDGTWPATPAKRAKRPGRLLAKGTVVDSLAWARIAFVERPGQR
jgi:hypothetical protein